MLTLLLSPPSRGLIKENESSDAAEFKKIEKDGWQNIGSAAVQLRHNPSSPTLRMSTSRGEINELAVLRRCIPDEWLEDEFLPLVNKHLNSLSTASGDRNSKKNSIGMIDWWRYFAQFLSVHLVSSGALKREAIVLLPPRAVLCGKHRFELISSSTRISYTEFESLVHSAMNLIWGVINPGNTLVIDESMFPYTGQDMRDAGIDMLLQGKPHPYGQMAHGGMMRLSYTGLPIIVTACFRTPENKLSPSAAAYKMISNVAKRIFGKLHVIMDSGFHAGSTLRNGVPCNTIVTIAINTSSSSGYRNLTLYASSGLSPGKTRTYNNDGVFAQFRFKKGHITSVISTAWRAIGCNVPNTITPKLAYKTALSMALDSTFAAVCLHYRLDPDTHRKQLRQIIFDKEGWDIAFPEPDSKGKVDMAREKFANFRVEQLGVLNHLMPNPLTGKKATKPALVDSIIERINMHGVKPLYQCKTKKRKFPDPCEPRNSVLKSPIVDYYTAHYNLQDRFNKEYFEVFTPALMHDGGKLFIMSWFIWQIENAWAIHSELTAIKASVSNSPINLTDVTSKHMNVTMFIVNLIDCIHKEL